MRARLIPDLLNEAICAHFPDDVAAAITADSVAMAAAIHLAGQAATTPEELTTLIAAIAADVDDRLADWLTDRAEAPAAWLAAQIRDY
ncbi:hypothetical protein ACSDR0_11610 [Streptosporangium sp. G11]|uniref:hypothetical protein n=1 Tax=Streptosporangium sp. G11 TaxID=3436926 RepID=UPI003EB8633F